MERLRVGVIPQSVTGLTQPPHVKRTAVVMVGRFDASTGGPTFLAGIRADHDALVDCMPEGSLCSTVDRDSFGVSGLPTTSAHARFALILWTSTVLRVLRQDLIAIFQIVTPRLSRSLHLLSLVAGGSTWWAAIGSFPNPAGSSRILDQVCQTGAATLRARRGRGWWSTLVLHRVNSGVRDGQLALRRPTLLPSIIPADQIWRAP